MNKNTVSKKEKKGSATFPTKKGDDPIVLVTGATGLIGTNLVRTLCENGQKVRILIRKTSSREGFKGLKNLEIAYGDVTNYREFRKALEGVDYVYHLAAKVALGPFRREELFKTNVDGVKNLCKAALDAGVKRVVYTSSIATIADGSKAVPANEDTFYSSYKIECPYWTSKYLAELVLLDAVNNHGLDAVILNPAVVIGPWDIKPSSGAIILWAAKWKGIPFYPKRGMINVVDVRDVVEAQISAMKKGRTGQRYILSNYTLSKKDLIVAIANALKFKRPRFSLNTKLGYPITLLFDVLGKFIRSSFFDQFNSLVLKIMDGCQYVDVTKAKTELNFPKTDLKMSILDTYDWFKEHGRL